MAGFYSARGSIMPPLPWPTFAPPLSTSAGLPWLKDVFGKAYDPAIAEALVKAEILDTDGVTEITSFSIAFDRGSRGLAIRSVEVMTEFDEEVSV